MPRIEQASSTSQIQLARELIREYADSLGVNLDFQDFERELRDLPAVYSPPAGRLLLAYQSVEGAEQAAGCGALRPLTPEICEMKRLYVRPHFRGCGIGRALADALIAAAKQIGYCAMRLDTLPRMTEAHALYGEMGFREIAAYRHNPVAGTRFLELELSSYRIGSATAE
jgi:putative acetyltransferase